MAGRLSRVVPLPLGDQPGRVQIATGGKQRHLLDRIEETLGDATGGQTGRGGGGLTRHSGEASSIEFDRIVDLVKIENRLPRSHERTYVRPTHGVDIDEGQPDVYW